MSKIKLAEDKVLCQGKIFWTKSIILQPRMAYSQFNQYRASEILAAQIENSVSKHSNDYIHVMQEDEIIAVTLDEADKSGLKEIRVCRYKKDGIIHPDQTNNEVSTLRGNNV